MIDPGMSWNLLVTWGGTFLAGAFGVGVGYATIRERLKADRELAKAEFMAIRTEFLAYKDTAVAAASAAAIVASDQLLGLKERMVKAETHSEYQVGYSRCKDMREECGKRVSDQLISLSKQVGENRDVVVKHITDTMKFLGRVERYMEENGKHSNKG